MVHSHPFYRSSFWMKAAAAAVLIGLADILFFLQPVGSTLGAFALAWVAAVLLVRPGLFRDRRALVAMGAAAAFGLVMVDRPDLLAFLLFGLSLTVAVLSARVKAGDPAWRWVQRLAVHGVFSAAGPMRDFFRLNRPRPGRRPGRSPWLLVSTLALPLVGGAVFLMLFASANPLISDALDRLRLPALTAETLLRGFFWGFVLLAAWSTLRPRWRRRLFELPSMRDARMPGVSGASITLSLLVFNALFAVQNGLDIAFLWSGAPLPGDLTLADYAHRGAYPLIATALLAGLFVLVVLRPGSETAKKPLVRRLVVVWVAQNMLLVASSMLRTADYIGSFSLTGLRIAAMIWMAMVGVGLVLICWRMLKDKDGHWLIDANVRLVLVVLAAVSLVDLGSIAAWWNVRHAREVGGPAVELDLGYLHSIGSPALVSLVELEQTTTDPVFRDRVAAVRWEILAEVRAGQSDWRSWTWRDARRLDRVAELAAVRPLIRPKPGAREWDGGFRPPPPPPPPPPLQPQPLAAPPAPLPGPAVGSNPLDAPLTSSPGV